MEKEVGTIAHSCGVKEPRQLNRNYARVVTDMGKSMSFADLYPDCKDKKKA